MSLRPKRKATINKSYMDSLEEVPYDDAAASGSSSSTSSGSSAQPPPPGTSPSKRKPAKRTLPPESVPKSNKPSIPYNWQPSPAPTDYFSHKLNLTDAYIDLRVQTLYCPYHSASGVNDSKRKKKPTFSIARGDYIYMVSEPPGEPYYIGRVMGYKARRKDDAALNDYVTIQNTADPVVLARDYQFQIQWFYRPRDISKITSDSRLLFSSMHTDTCPLISFRGKVTVRLKQDIEDDYNLAHLARSDNKTAKKAPSPSSTACLEEYTQEPNCFYFDKLFDRYMIKFYDVLLTNNLLQYAKNETSRSRNFLIALNKRFEFIFVESQRTKSFINSFSSSSCNCEKCGQWCASNDSINCVLCMKHYHMLCLEPPLLKKPSRGFSWSCAVCTKKHEIEYLKKRMLMLSNDNKSSNAKQLSSELIALSTSLSDGKPSLSPSASLSPEEEIESDTIPDESSEIIMPKHELMAIDFLDKDSKMTFEERRLSEEWCLRYLGIHARLEDAVDPEDRSPYPRASTRLGSKHQATNIPEYEDHPIIYYDVEKQIKKKPTTTNQKTAKEPATKLEVPEEFKDTLPKDYPQWLQPRPKGYIERGLDDGEGETCTLLWKTREEDIDENFVKLDTYIERCDPIATSLNILPTTPNFMDAILKLYLVHDGDVEAAFAEVQQLTRKSLKEPTFNREEIKRFEAGVKEFGSELYHVHKNVKSQTCGMVVRFYYNWKKSKNGRLIWGNFEGRLHKKVQAHKEEAKLEHSHTAIDDFANPEDDSSYENEKVLTQQRPFTCKHCHTFHSPQWFRITGHDANLKKKREESEKYPQNTVVGLCFRCARLWRLYAVLWEDPNEVEKKKSKPTGWKRKIEMELVTDATRIMEEAESRGAVLSFSEDIPGQPVLLPDVVKKRPLVTKKVEVRAEIKKQEPKKTVETKKKVTKPKKEPENSVPSVDDDKKKAPKPKKRPVKKETKTNEKIKIEKENDIEANTLKRVMEETPVESNGIAEDPTVKRQRRPNVSLLEKLIAPFYRNYTLPANPKLDKKNPLRQSPELIANFVTNFRERQLSDIASYVQSLQIPHISSIELPFNVNERKCCVCREHDTSEASSLEMLICSHCGVNSHASCTAISVPENVGRPVKEWLCDVCVNDLNPRHSTVYSCCLCLANESNYELSIMGLPLVKPDFLKSIGETGRWCHLLCALFSHKLIEFVTVPEVHRKKDDLVEPNSTLGIGSVSRVYLNNFTSTCGICDSRNGSLINCELCEGDNKYHVTCAQDTPNFKLGFKIDSSDKDNRTISVGGVYGTLKPILVCPKHDQASSTVYNIRTLGKRNGIKEERPLIQLFIEDICKNETTKLSGPQFRAFNYVLNCQTFDQKQHNNIKVSSDPVVKREIACDKCHNTASPIWWNASAVGQTTSEDDYRQHIYRNPDHASKVLCHSCFNDTGDIEEEQNLVEVLSKLLEGVNYGIVDENDNLASIFKPNLVSLGAESLDKVPGEAEVRSSISLGDILS